MYSVSMRNMELTLEQELQNAFDEIEIAPDQRHSLTTILNMVKLADVPTYEHMIRCGLLGIKVAKFTHIVDPKALFYADLLHDAGKLLSDPASLKKTEGFGAEDMQEMKKHPVDGYRLLRGIHDFSARILLYHHKYVGEGYPEQIPQSCIDFSEGSAVNIRFYARIVGLIDFNDAMMHRENEKFGGVPTREQGREIMLKHNPDQSYFINQLYDNNIF